MIRSSKLQAQYSWSGNLGVKANVEVVIGNYDFQNGTSYVIKVWTSEPNSASDCNHKNDTVTSVDLSGALCGNYTIGGENPDFTTFTQAAEVLNTAGITCPVTFYVRDGIYTEKFILNEIKGSSATNTVSFISESGDSSLAVIKAEMQMYKE